MINENFNESYVNKNHIKNPRHYNQHPSGMWKLTKTINGKNTFFGSYLTEKKAEKEGNAEMVNAYTNVLNLIYDADALKDLKFIEYHDKEGNVQTLTPIKIINLTKFKMVIKERVQ